MKHCGAYSLNRAMIVSASIAIAMIGIEVLACSSALAQRIPLVVEPNAAGAKAQSVINRAGSYVLSRDLVLSKAGVDGIDITSPNVTLDLQGFSIISNSNSAKTGDGINATGQANVIIRNGIITGVGGAAIVTGATANISGITATGNGTGITCNIGCLAHDNVIQGNTGIGMTFSDATSGYGGNVLQGNNGNTVGTGGQVSGGTSLGHNVCNGTSC